MGIKRPIIILGAPRSGTSLLFSIFSSHPDLWSLYTESEWVLGRHLRLEEILWEKGHALGANDAPEKVLRGIRRDFYKEVQNYQALSKNTYSKMSVGVPPVWYKVRRRLHRYVFSPLLKPDTVRIVEKTPKNCVRVPFIERVFPDAFFIFLTRDPRTNINSLIEGWQKTGSYHIGEGPSDLQVEGYSGGLWNFLMPPGWERYTRGCSLQEVCAFQYRSANGAVLDALSHVPENRKATLRYEDLVAHPEKEVERLCGATGLSYSGGLRKIAEQLPPVNASSPPDSQKWLKNEQQVLSVLETVKDVSEEMGYTL